MTSQSRGHLRHCVSLLTLAFVGLSNTAQAQTQVEGLPQAPVSNNAAAQDDPFQIRFRADTLIVAPVLNAELAEAGKQTVVIGQTAHFQTFNNYPAFIDYGEIRVFKAGQSPDSDSFATIKVDANGAAFWKVPSDTPEALFFTFRVFDKDGMFDETTPRELTAVTRDVADKMEFGDRPSYPEFGTVDQASRRAIKLNGLMATVSGRADPSGDRVTVGGLAVPVDRDGKFAVQQIVPRDGGGLDVVISRDGKEVKRVRQAFSAPRNEWFVVGQGDLTLGTSHTTGPARTVSGDITAEGDYLLGRAAFYAKGVVGDDWRVTASLDTGETLVKDLFSNFDRKDPRQLLRRMNSEQYYPTYGDDSTLVEDAPTQGRFYLRVQKAASQLLVGNFTAEVNGSDLAQLDRGLFGVLADLKTESTTGFGAHRAQLLGFASDPGTVPGREEFRGTGGSLYFLKRQDVSVGSERVRVEVRDRETGIVIESHELHPQQDYDFDPIQGRLTLLKPLASTAASGSAVREGSSTGNVPVLVVRYEYTPPVSSLDGYTLGGRGSVWLGDTVRLGMTAQRDTVDSAEQTLLGADAMVRITAGTYFKGEVAQTEGPGFGQSNSVDGGLTFTDIATPGLAGAKAQAWRTELGVNFAELAHRQGDLGGLSAYYEHQDKGFSSAGRLSPAETERWGAAAKVPLGSAGSISAKYDELLSANSGRSKTGVVDLASQLRAKTGNVTIKGGLRYEDRAPGLLYNSVQNGSRTDAAIEVGFSPVNANWTLNAFGQATLDRDAGRNLNNRAGVGLKAQLDQRLSFAGELSGGNGGLGADLQLNHKLGDGSEAYVGYALYADRTDTGFDPQNIFTRSNRGSLVVGSRRRFSDSFSVYGENRIGIGGAAPSLMRSFGLRYDPTSHLSVTGSLENGRIDDATTGEFRRTAASIGVGYTTERARWGSSLEMRNDNGIGRDQTVWLMRNNLSYAVNPDWRFIGEFNFAKADNESPSVRAAEFTQGMAGFAYRPVNNERFNALLRFQYFEDLGPVGQVTGSGQTQSPKQTSTIFSADFNYDLSEKLTLGGKYGYRMGKVSLGRDSDTFISSDAHLAVVRLDYNVTKEWDALAEGRALWVTQAHDTRWGALGAIYRHLGNNVKLGVGYSWSDFSDDLTDQSYSSHGPFLNLLGKF